MSNLTTTPRHKTFKAFMKTRLADYLDDIANHGADAGYPCLTYYTDTVKLYKKYEQEIWELATQEAEGLGRKNAFEMIADFRYAEGVTDFETMANLMVWYAAEHYAQELTNTD